MRYMSARLLLAVLALAVAGPVQALPSSQLSVTGAVQTSLVLELDDLKVFPTEQQTVSYLSGSTAQTHAYTGTRLWGVLQSAGVRTDPAVKNDVLNKVVLATGSDGYRVVYSLGELSPSFGNRPDLLAYAETINGATTALTADGFARVTVPGDIRGGRYVSNLVALDVRDSGSTAKGTGGGRSTQFSVSGAVQHAGSFDLAALKALTSKQTTVNGVTYTGVSLWDLLNTAAGLATDGTVKNDVLSFYVVATGSDGYKAAFSLGELNPNFGNQPGLIAYEADGQPLDGNGFARIVVPNDVKAGRWVSNLVSLEVFRAVTPVPEPATLALFCLGGVMLALKLRAGMRVPGGGWRL